MTNTKQRERGMLEVKTCS